jgi:hypothetical protein
VIAILAIGSIFRSFDRTPPFEAAPPVSRETAPGIDEQVAAAIMKGLEADPTQRWQTVDPMIYQFREAQERLFPGKPKKTARPLVENRPQPKSKPSTKPTPGITLAEEGITLAEDQPEDIRRKVSAKPAAATPGITIAEEGISLAADQPPDARALRTAKSKEPTPGISIAEEGITPAEASPDARPVPPEKSAQPAPGISLAKDEPQTAEKQSPHKSKP